MSATPKPCSCGCSCGPNRREFLTILGAGAAAALAGGLPASGGHATPPPFDQLIPPDKKLPPDWVRSLTARGEPEVYRGQELTMIGMPIGGIGAGQVYLGGDGRLLHWDIFNQPTPPEYSQPMYARPVTPTSPIDQGFAIRIKAGGKSQTRALDRTGFSDITFRGEYPIGFVEYRDPACPAAVSLEAFSPFIPLSTDDSSLPATVMQFKVRNTGPEKIEGDLAGWIENAVCRHTGQPGEGVRRNSLVPPERWHFLECRAEPAPEADRPAKRPDIVFDDFEKDSYEGWTVTGTAFGAGPVEISKIPSYQGDVGGQGKRVVNSHASAPGGNVAEKDAATGTLTSRPFVLERNYITFLIGGGAHKDKTCINLRVDDKVVLSATGKNDNRMLPHSFDVRPWAGKTAVLQIVDDEKGGWGNIGIDDIVLSDERRGPAPALAERTDFGTMGLAILDAADGGQGASSIPDGPRPECVFADAGLASGPDADRPFGRKLTGAVGRRFTLEPGKETTVTFIVVWHFPNLHANAGPQRVGNHYAVRFKDAAAVAAYVVRNFESLASQTRQWRQTWYDSTLPWWFLTRTFVNTSILASATCQRWGNGRLWGWEGVGCCTGTCTHVWQYAHAAARIFPELERSVRELQDFGIGFDEKTGMIAMRGEFGRDYATDGQAGRILSAYREHQMSANDAFLKRNWPRIRKATEFLIRHDPDQDGIIEDGQPNTLDTAWFGPIAWISGLYLASLRAAEEMARDAGDPDFARLCRGIFDAGSKKIVGLLFNGEYFIQKPDPAHPEAMKSGSGCEIDQVLGQSWAFQVDLGRIFPEKETRQALASLWKYNFTLDVGPFRAVNKGGRWYAMPGEGGLIMCTFPKGGGEDAGGKAPDWAVGYFNECMNGFEYQVAGHMIWEGLVQEGLAVTRALHDRYHPSRRNPYNEIECGNHYARSMASYGIFLAACGYEHHGPKGHLGFAPRLGADDFRAPFTTAEGWGTFTQKRTAAGQQAAVEMKSGRLRLKTFALGLPEKAQPKSVKVTLGGKTLAATHAVEADRVVATLAEDAIIPTGGKLEVAVAW